MRFLKKTILILITLFTLNTLFLSKVNAADTVPRRLNYQGRLMDSSDNLLTGTYYFCFSIWDNATVGAGSQVWPASTPTPTAITTSNGVFSAEIGSADALSLDFDAYDYYLQVYVNSSNSCSSGGETLSPRQHLTSSAYSINADMIDGADAGTSANNVLLLDAEGDIDFNGEVFMNDGKKIYLGTGDDAQIYVDANDDLYIRNGTQDQDIIFQVNNAGSDINAIFIDASSGSVGIGEGANTAGHNVLSVDGGSSISLDVDDDSLTINNVSTSLFYVDGLYRQLALGNYYGGSSSIFIDSISNNISLGIDINESLYIDNTNNRAIFSGLKVGIGNTAPTAKLQITADTATTTALIVRGDTNDTNNIQEWLTGSTGVTLLRVEKDGDLTFNDGQGIQWTNYNSKLIGNYSTIRVFQTANTDGTRTVGYRLASDTSTTGYVQYMSQFYGTKTVADAYSYYGLDFYSRLNATSGTQSTMYGINSRIRNSNTADITNAYGTFSRIDNESTGTISNAYALYLDTPVNSGGGTLTTAYGLYINNQNAASTNFSIYSAGGTNYFAGDLGIGTTAPDGNLHILTYNSPSEIKLEGVGTTGYPYGNLIYHRARGTLSSKAAVIDNDVLGAYIARGHDGTSYSDAASIGFYVDGTVSTGIVPAEISFGTRNSSGTWGTRMTIDSTGNVNIPTSGAQLLGPNGSVVAGNAPGIAFTSYPDDGIASNGSNLGFWQDGVLALNLADSLKEFRVPADYKFAFSSATNNNAASDTSFYRNSAGVLRTGGDFLVDGKLGIGTTELDQKLSVYDITANAKISVGHDVHYNWRIGRDRTDGRLFVESEFDNVVTEPFTVLYTGNVGIGTTAPGAKLEVVGNLLLSGSSRYLNFSATEGTSGYGFRDNSGTIQYKNSGGSWADLTSGTGTSLWTDATTYIYPNNYTSFAITDVGKVGIGTTDPTNTLDVVGLIASFTRGSHKLYLNPNWGEGDVYAGVYTNTDIDLGFGTNNSATQLYLDNGGNTGIGTTTPTSKLNVVDDYAGTTAKVSQVISTTWTPDGALGTVYPAALTLSSRINNTQTIAGGFATAFRNFVYNDGSVAFGVTRIQDILYTNTGSATVSQVNYLHLRNPSNTGTGSITTARGLYIEDFSTASSNNRGIESVLSSGTGKFNLYISGTANNYFAGNVGIGTTAPVSELNVESSSTATTRGITITQTNSTYSPKMIFRKQNDGGTVTTGNYLAATVYQPYVSSSGYIQTAGFGAYINGTVTSTTAATDLYFYAGSANDLDTFANGTVDLIIKSSGYVGVGLTNPAGKLHVASDITTAFDITGDAAEDNVQLRIGDIAGNYGFYFAYDGTGSGNANYLRLVTENGDGTDINIFSAGQTTGGIDFYGGYASTGASISQAGYFTSSGRIGVGTSAPATALEAVASGATVATFNRTTSDGTIVSLQQAGTEEGYISVSGTTVTYAQFTGSHIGWTDQVIERGKVVTMTGDNRYFHNNPESEIMYGIVESTIANDPRILGSYLSLKEPTQEASADNPHQIMSVGNGDMWIVDTGKNVKAGDYLISSDVNGHAMIDSDTFAISYIIARSGEDIDWSKITETTTDDNGNIVKHKKISVFYESFSKNNDPLNVTDILQAIADQKVIVEKLSSLSPLADKIKFDENGNVVFKEGVNIIAKSNIEVGGKLQFGESSSVGEGIITAGATEVVIGNNLISETSKIFITPTTSTFGENLYIGSQTEGVGFIVKIDAAVLQDIEFNYWIVD